MEAVQLVNRAVYLLGVISLAMFVLPALTRGRGYFAIHCLGLVALVLAYAMAVVGGMMAWDVVRLTWTDDGDGWLRLFSGVVICVSIAFYWASGTIGNVVEAYRNLAARVVH